MSEWKGAHGRISLFLLPSVTTPSAIELFRKIWGVDPDNYKKQANPLMPTVADGSRNGITVNCAIQPGRIDLNITPPHMEASDMSIPLIDDSEKLHAELVRIIKAIPESGVSGPVTRVAIIARFTRLGRNVAEANNILTDAMPPEYRVRITDETDFVLQANRPYKFSDRITMNAIKRWNVDRIQVMSIKMQAGGNLATAGNTATAEFMAANVLLEMNNVPVPEQGLSVAEQTALLEEGLNQIGKSQKHIGLGIKGF